MSTLLSFLTSRWWWENRTMGYMDSKNLYSWAKKERKRVHGFFLEKGNCCAHTVKYNEYAFSYKDNFWQQEQYENLHWRNVFGTGNLGWDRRVKIFKKILYADVFDSSSIPHSWYTYSYSTHPFHSQCLTRCLSTFLTDWVIL